MEEQWNQAVLVLGGTPNDAAADLTRRYEEPHRLYHNTSHVLAVLRAAREIADVTSREWAILTLAICAHDVIYDARPGDDERASAAWARTQLSSSGVAAHHVEQVASLVLATLGHQSDDPLAHVLLDADLSILGSAPEVYDAYAVAVRAEYSAVSESSWRQGRSKVLRSLLDRADLFRTPQAISRWDALARENLRRELSTLREDSPKS
ncbi:hypothetical protein LWC34_26260 [Kibdelosporangium philippinense]|uniref:Metal-dependent phosphohydrolase n=1 Tax=Kibdelosporangium philippinense TaxID=211113 RepID=A0ABS8ZHD0_9PSEU|nr:hypothetical protein [Kibdelosporangium philippinense]MCE7006310.1 hypothetical protein [Kibdelosporangium philippinense]